MAVCDKTYRLYMRRDGPYANQLIAVEPYEEIPAKAARPFDCGKNARRHAKETKGQDYDVTATGDSSCCGPDGCC